MPFCIHIVMLVCLIQVNSIGCPSHEDLSSQLEAETTPEWRKNFENKLTVNFICTQVVLVTGASGFVASHIINLLFECGANVRGTVRDMNNQEQVNLLKKLFPNLELVGANLLDENSWKNAVAGCKYVVHAASPFPKKIPKNPNDLINPAVEGTLNVLKACAEEPSVQRVVVTSSMYAVYDATMPIPSENENSTFKETDWTNIEVDGKKVDAYSESKVQAEKAADEFISNWNSKPGNKKLEMSTIQPGMILGPLLNKSNPTSVRLVRRFLSDIIPAIPNVMYPLADVRDVAKAHLKALITDEAQGNRHLVLTKSVTFQTIARILINHYKDLKIVDIVPPNCLIRAASLILTELKILCPRLGREYYYDNKRMTEVLKVTPTPIETMIMDTAKALVNLKIVKAKQRNLDPDS